jgi:hypothetical protein
VPLIHLLFTLPVSEEQDTSQLTAKQKFRLLRAQCNFGHWEYVAEKDAQEQILMMMPIAGPALQYALERTDTPSESSLSAVQRLFLIDSSPDAKRQKVAEHAGDSIQAFSGPADDHAEGTLRKIFAVCIKQQMKMQEAFIKLQEEQLRQHGDFLATLETFARK